ncbi:hypothetical protein HY408_01125 [Candidatus Gottesmanbacteria bacterium]|nr:hypothetical protein [Candidatus Gottesmanbacteria bacterium]
MHVDELLRVQGLEIQRNESWSIVLDTLETLESQRKIPGDWYLYGLVDKFGVVRALRYQLPILSDNLARDLLRLTAINAPPGDLKPLTPKHQSHIINWLVTDGLLDARDVGYALQVWDQVINQMDPPSAFEHRLTRISTAPIKKRHAHSEFRNARRILESRLPHPNISLPEEQARQVISSLAHFYETAKLYADRYTIDWVQEYVKKMHAQEAWFDPEGLTIPILTEASILPETIDGYIEKMLQRRKPHVDLLRQAGEYWMRWGNQEKALALFAHPENSIDLFWVFASELHPCIYRKDQTTIETLKTHFDRHMRERLDKQDQEIHQQIELAHLLYVLHPDFPRDTWEQVRLGSEPFSHFIETDIDVLMAVARYALTVPEADELFILIERGVEQQLAKLHQGLLSTHEASTLLQVLLMLPRH